jgi:hypothetical protein
VGGLVWWARIDWLQSQRPMWREHDATLAAVWRPGRDSQDGHRPADAKPTPPDVPDAPDAPEPRQPTVRPS